MSLWKRKDSPLWYYDFSVDGIRYRGSCRTAKKTQAKDYEAERMAEARKLGPYGLRSRKPISLKELSKRFFALVEASQLAENTKRDYEYGWSLLEKTELIRKQVRAITADDALLALASVESPYAANSALRTLRRILHKAKEWDCIGTVPVITLRKAPGRTGVYDAASEAALLAHASQPLRDVLLILIDTGARPFEVMRMRWEDVRWEAKAIHIPLSKTERGVRNVPMSSRVMDALMIRADGKKEGWVFPAAKQSKKGHALVPNQAFRAAREAAGLDKNLVLYSCRHTFGTYAMAATGNVHAVMRAMGHTNVASMTPYQHPGIEEIRDAIEKRNSVVERPN